MIENPQPHDGYMVEHFIDAEGWGCLRFLTVERGQVQAPRATPTATTLKRWHPTGCVHGEWPEGVTFCSICDHSGVAI